MKKTKNEKMMEILKDLIKVGGVEGSSIVSRDGLLIASDLLADVDTKTFAAMSAAMTGAAETAVAELKKGNPDQIIVNSKMGSIIATGAGKTAILVCLIKPKANLGLILLSINTQSKKIARILR
ncbi:MAG: roadblock/LC7 domain-containing protein [Candidatus Woesearchaeota archaeon]